MTRSETLVAGIGAWHFAPSFMTGNVTVAAVVLVVISIVLAKRRRRGLQSQR